jgi:hypothetical protein
LGGFNSPIILFQVAVFLHRFYLINNGADYYPVLGQIMREMDVAGTINRTVDAGDSQAKIDVGTFVCLMIHNLLGDVNIRLYNMDSFFEDKALPLLVPWKPYIGIIEINDDRAARELDTM